MEYFSYLYSVSMKNMNKDIMNNVGEGIKDFFRQKNIIIHLRIENKNIISFYFTFKMLKTTVINENAYQIVNKILTDMNVFIRENNLLDVINVITLSYEHINMDGEQQILRFEPPRLHIFKVINLIGLDDLSSYRLKYTIFMDFTNPDMISFVYSYIHNMFKNSDYNVHLCTTITPSGKFACTFYMKEILNNLTSAYYNQLVQSLTQKINQYSSRGFSLKMIFIDALLDIDNEFISLNPSICFHRVF